MFESAEIGHQISKAAYREALPALRAALLEAQVDLDTNRKSPVVVLISGQDGAGKGETINTLYEWMDPRFISTLAFAEPTDEERDRPAMWRYWRSLPPKGRVGIFAGSWYSDPIRQRVQGEIPMKDLDARADQINRFEQMLVNEGALVLKFWFHLTKEGQKTRLKALESDPRTAWRVTQWNWDRLKTYDRLQEVAGHFLRVTNTSWAPWVVVEGTDDRYRSLTVGKILLDAMKQKLASPDRPASPLSPMVRVDTDGRNVLSELNLNLKLADKAYGVRTRASGRPACPSWFVTRASRAGHWSALSRGPTQRARAAPSGASAARWMRGSTGSFRWLRPPRRSGRNPTCGDSGGTFRARGRSSSSTAPGMDGCWSSASRGSAARTTGRAPTARSTTSSMN